MTVSQDRLSGEMLDSRDLIEWLEKDYDPVDATEDEDEMAEAITKLADEGIEDWEFGAPLIRSDFFTRYAEELADDIGAVDRNATWPLAHINWEAAADDLKLRSLRLPFHPLSNPRG